MLSTGQAIANPGLSGFSPVGDTRLDIFLKSLLALIDIYLIWYMLLLVIGVRSSTKVSPGKAFVGVFLTILIALALGALVSFVSSLLSNLTIVRPFFF